MDFDFALLKPQERYKLLTGLIVPRPIAWVTSLNQDGSVNLVSEALAEAMNITATEFPPEISEVEVAGLQTVPSVHVAVPRLAQAPAGFECRLHTVLEIGRNRMLIGEVLGAFVQDRLVADVAKLHLKTQELGLIGRMGGRGGYVRTTDLFEMPRVSYEEWRKEKA